MTRLQSDTGLIATNVSVVAGSYTAVNVTVSAPSGVLFNSSSATVGTCPAATACTISGSAATITYTFPSALTLTTNATQWLNLDFNLSNAINSSTGNIDVTQSNVLTASSTVPTGVPSGSYANIDDFTGAVTAISSSSITLQSSVRGTLTATINSSTAVYDPQTQCTNTASPLTCIQKGSIVSLQGLLSTSGVVTATSLDIIDISTSPADEVEGLIYPTTCNGGSNYGMILSDSVIFTSGSPLLTSSGQFGAFLCLTLNPAATFAIDTGILTGQGVPTTVGFTNSNDILLGQTVRAKITGATSGTNSINATATALILRFSHFTATVGTVSGSSFGITALPPYFPSFIGTPLARTYTNATIFEGVTDASTLGGQTVALSTLFLNPNDGEEYPFQVVKVRLQ